LQLVERHLFGINMAMRFRQHCSSMVKEIISGRSYLFVLTYKNCLCTKGQRLENICSSPYSSIKENRNSPSYGLNHLQKKYISMSIELSELIRSII
jgi:hypothetical protein